MSATQFENLCTGLCAVAACAPLQFAVNDAGARAASLMQDGVEVTLAHDPSRGSGHAFVQVRFGSLPEGRELAACIALLQTTSLMLSAQSPAFGLDPATGEVVLHHRCELRSTTPPDLYQMIVRLCGIARDWRDTHFLP